MRYRVAVLSVLIPAFNEADKIGPMLKRLAELAWVRRMGASLEVLVVDDGSSDGTEEVALREAQRFAAFRVVRFEANRGKGRALANALAQARGESIAFVDGDDTFELADLEKFYTLVSRGADVVVGDRRSPASVFCLSPTAIPYIHLRHFVGTEFNRIIRKATGLAVHDTQCGFKMFSRRAAEDCFSRVRMGGFVFDLELLLAARAAGYTIHTLPVTLRYDDREPLTDVVAIALRVAVALRHVFAADRAGLYGPNPRHVTRGSGDATNQKASG